MQKLQSQGVHHITLSGANRKTSIDFWEGVLGMPFVFEQPNLDKASVHHVAFSVSRATFSQAVKRLDERKISHSGVKDRGFMDSIYFTDPLGLLVELASYRFEPPHGFTHADVLMEAHKIRVLRSDGNIAEVHLADAIEALVTRRNASLSTDRSPKNPY
jgi:hypothetical protein